ncbi:MAG: peptide deformylase [Candidatus Omnitrophica bacterium]|nr:peptide deformylase [Candidatus Omnitrophota bacterium]
MRPLCLEPQPVLRAAACRVRAFTDDVRRLVDDLIETMYANDGIGLAAPQIGRDAQVFVANPSRHPGQELVMVNPALEWSAGRAGIVEGCLSVPDVWAKIRRAARVRMHGCDAAGAAYTVTAEGLLAIVLQHEFDHLQGRLFIDRLPWWRRLTTRRPTR